MDTVTSLPHHPLLAEAANPLPARDGETTVDLPPPQSGLDGGVGSPEVPAAGSSLGAGIPEFHGPGSFLGAGLWLISAY